MKTTVSEAATQSPEVDVPQSSLESAEEPEMSQEEFEAGVAQFISERLGLELDSLEQLTEILNAPKQTADIDERVKAIADFVAETGRDPQDWFTYQSLNPSEMDDLAAVKLQMAVEYPNLASEEIDMLIGSKYKIDEDLVFRR
jgi:aminopeptidase N